jgi:uncharacterized protein YndB with AHSA1/START domain
MAPAPEAIRQGDIPGVRLRCRRLLAWPPEEVWDWLVEPPKLVRWLALEAAVEGERETLLLTGRGETAPEGARRERGRTLAIDPPRLWRLAFEELDAGWPVATRLVVKLHRLPPGSEIDLVQEGFHRLPPAVALTAWDESRRRWRRALDRLAAIFGAP